MGPARHSFSSPSSDADGDGVETVAGMLVVEVMATVVLALLAFISAPTLTHTGWGWSPSDFSTQLSSGGHSISSHVSPVALLPFTRWCRGCEKAETEELQRIRRLVRRIGVAQLALKGIDMGVLVQLLQQCRWGVRWGSFRVSSKGCND